MPNDKYTKIKYVPYTKADGRRYVQVRDVNNNQIEIDITDDQEGEYDNTTHYEFAPVKMRPPNQRRRRKHIKRKNKIDQVRILSWGASFVDVRARYNYDENTKPWKGITRVPHPSIDKVEERLLRTGTPLGQVKKLRRQYIMGLVNKSLENFYRKKDPRSKKIELEEEFEVSV